jgi:hypothetical protein
VRPPPSKEKTLVRKAAYLEVTLQQPSTSTGSNPQHVVQSGLAGEHQGLRATVISASADRTMPDRWHVVVYVEGEQPAPENFRRLATDTLQHLWERAAPAPPPGVSELAEVHPQLLRIGGWEGYDTAVDALSAPSGASSPPAQGGQPRPQALQILGPERQLAELGRGCLAPVTGGAPAAAPPLPADARRPTLRSGVFDGCPAGGDGDDAQQDALKNRTDTGSWVATTVGAVLALPMPPNLPDHRRDWSDADRQAIAAYEGLPLQVVGYLAGARMEGPESCNCHSASDVDFHLWVVDASGTGREASVVCEVTPRVRALHAGWSIESLCTLVTRQAQVRISGWLMMDPAHPDQVGQTRGTTWEIHPIMSIEVNQGGKWVALDDVANRPARRLTLPGLMTRLFARSATKSGGGR